MGAEGGYHSCSVRFGKLHTMTTLPRATLSFLDGICRSTGVGLITSDRKAVDQINDREKYVSKKKVFRKKIFLKNNISIKFWGEGGVAVGRFLTSDT